MLASERYRLKLSRKNVRYFGGASELLLFNIVWATFQLNHVQNNLHSLWFDPIGARTQYIPHSWRARSPLHHRRGYIESIFKSMSVRVQNNIFCSKQCLMTYITMSLILWFLSIKMFTVAYTRCLIQIRNIKQGNTNINKCN